VPCRTTAAGPRGPGALSATCRRRGVDAVEVDAGYVQVGPWGVKVSPWHERLCPPPSARGTVVGVTSALEELLIRHVEAGTMPGALALLGLVMGRLSPLAWRRWTASPSGTTRSSLRSTIRRRPAARSPFGIC
jgi:hypothetical protein